jgi:hypothetical protein
MFMEEQKQKSTTENHLPKRKFNSPISRIVCWRCKLGRRPLYNVKDSKGKKTQDYVCDIDMMLGFYKPAIGNQSQIFFRYAN